MAIPARIIDIILFDFMIWSIIKKGKRLKTRNAHAKYNHFAFVTLQSPTTFLGQPFSDKYILIFHGNEVLSLSIVYY